MGSILKNIVIAIFIIPWVSCKQELKKYPLDKIKSSQVISDHNNTLTGKIESQDVDYTAFGCACLGWIRVEDLKSVNKEGIKNLYFYIEPADENMGLPVYFDVFRHFLRIKGQFYTKEGVPKGTIQNEEPLPKGKVFRYTELEVLDKPDFKPETKLKNLILNYNAIACTCARWSESNKKGNVGKSDYYWLEPANKKLIDADQLFDGTHLPVKIIVTGHIVTERGFPKNKNLTKVNENEAGKVFRYTKIEVLQK